MVLETIGAGVLDQDDLYADNHSHSATEPGWYTGPDGLTWTMNDRRPAGFARGFVLFALANEDAISRKICWTIHHYRVAPIALVFGSAHWIVVRGYTASAAPANFVDASYTITAFDVNNPWPPTPSGPPLPPPPPHGAGDGCGSGGNRGIANEHIAYATWQADYMTGAAGGHWAGRFVAVCDPDPPPYWVGQRVPVEKGFPGDQLLDPSKAARRALEGLRRYGLYERDDWRPRLDATQPARPLLVQRLDHRDHFYYIVPMQDDQRRVPVLVSVDARFGNYRQSVAVHGGSTHIRDMVDPDAVASLVVGQRVPLPEPLGRLLVREAALCRYPALVWRPCRESLSPFWPFYMLTAGAHQIYVRIDGAVFTALHDQRGI